MNIRAIVGEAVGTFILVAFGSLGVFTLVLATGGQGSPQFAVLLIPIAFGLGLMAAIAIAGPASGGHFNPAVTLAALFDGRIDWKHAIGYVLAQIGGAVLASLGLRLISSIAVVAASVTQPGPTAESVIDMELHALAVEIILTAVFVAVILTVTRKAPDQAILVIPLTLVAIHYVGMTISGASVNPARSLAPAMVSGTYGSLWVYLAGPMAGSVLGWAIYRYLNPPDEELVEEDDEFMDTDLAELDEDEA